MRYAGIVVDIPLNTVNKVYDYYIPRKLKSEIEIGRAVRVPFGNRQVNGFVVELNSAPRIEEEKVKRIQKSIGGEVFFDEKLLKLFKWMARYYKANLYRVIKTAIPYGVVRGRIGEKRKTYYKPAAPEAEIRKAVESLKSRAPKQTEVLRVLLKNPDKDYTAAELAAAADTSTSTIYKLRNKDLLTGCSVRQIRRPFIDKSEKEAGNIIPTGKQAEVINEITAGIRGKNNQVFLLHGVTGSGKTEVYLRCIKHGLEAGLGAIVLVPEISLTPVMVRRFFARFGDQIAILHSNLSRGERYDEWKRIREGRARIAIGARSAVFAPVRDLGLIIIDEEHENTYKQTEYPRYHARMVARKRGEIQNIPVVLGSATPAVESYYRARKGRGNYKYLSLPERIHADRLPPVQVVDMREELKRGNTGIFSEPLRESLRETLDSGKQALLFLNRRGYASFVLCRECGFVIKCKNCDISLTFHAGENLLRCHYCDYHRKIPVRCPSCGSKYIKNFGIGTEKIEEEAIKEFPGARVDRMDVDTTIRKGAHHKILAKLESGETDILVGTQMIAKGHDYPGISVVGVITADTILNLPDFRAGERTFQLMTQVAGRTGRGRDPGRVIIQTYNPDDYSIKASKNHDYDSFFHREINLRKKLNYPPFVRLVNIITRGEEKTEVIQEAERVASLFKTRKGVEILGPSPAPLSKLRQKYRWQVILKFPDAEQRGRILAALEENLPKNRNKRVDLIIDIDPLSML